MSSFYFENPWVFISVNVVIWVVVGGVIELIYFGGNLLEAIIPAVAGGLASGFVLYNHRPETGK